ncbi:MAG: anaerobic ribonucleoside-triphosphate reductase activating protein [Clostridia bacterium]|nr:anaerobic ribonucleoside-triphosphate reductase activating protein [Clostridia bacterium]
MKYGNIKFNDIANGEGVRTSLFVSGCTHHCKECFNPETWSFDYGDEFTPEVEQKIIDSLEPFWIDGLSILGGEPFEPENQKALLPFIKRVKEKYPQKTIWCYSGYTFEELTVESRAKTDITKEILSMLDILIDGEFEIDKKDISLAFRGSSNQRVIDLKKTFETGNIQLYLE